MLWVEGASCLLVEVGSSAVVEDGDLSVRDMLRWRLTWKREDEEDCLNVQLQKEKICGKYSSKCIYSGAQELALASFVSDSTISFQGVAFQNIQHPTSKKTLSSRTVHTTLCSDVPTLPAHNCVHARRSSKKKGLLSIARRVLHQAPIS